MIPEHFYMTDLGMTAYTGLWVPLVVGLSILLGIKIKRSWPVIVPLGLVLLSLPFWDVYSIGRDADRLCKTEAGLHVYRTVEANSFRGGGNIVKLSKHGFSYAEMGWGEKIYHREVKGNKLVRYETNDFTTRYSIGDRGYQVVTKSIASNALQVVDLQTNEVLGELVNLSIHPGHFDGVFLKLFGSGPVVWHCGEESPDGRTKPLSFDDLILATLKPNVVEGDAK